MPCITSIALTRRRRESSQLKLQTFSVCLEGRKCRISPRPFIYNEAEETCTRSLRSLIYVSRAFYNLVTGTLRHEHENFVRRKV